MKYERTFVTAKSTEELKRNLQPFVGRGFEINKEVKYDQGSRTYTAEIRKPIGSKLILPPGYSQ